MKKPIVVVKEDGTIREDFKVNMLIHANGLFELIEEDGEEIYPDWVYDFIKKASYDRYMKSSEWKEKRKLAIEKENGRCQLCNSDRFLHVHHRTYERFGYEEIGDLTVLCGYCHAKHHGKLKTQD
jgi:hypothetical protein